MDFLDILKVVEPEEVDTYHQIFAVENQSPVIPVRVRLLDLMNHIVEMSGVYGLSENFSAHILNQVRSHSGIDSAINTLSNNFSSHGNDVQIHTYYAQSSLTLQNSWVDNGDSTYGTPAVVKQGKVAMLQGVLSPGTTADNTVIATIGTVTHRPMFNLRFGNYGQLQIRVKSNGEISIANFSAGVVSLAGIVYLTEYAG